MDMEEEVEEDPDLIPLHPISLLLLVAVKDHDNINIIISDKKEEENKHNQVRQRCCRW